VSKHLFEAGANIVSSDQYSTHPEHGMFFMRNAFWLPALESASGRAGFEAGFAPLAERFAMEWRIAYAHERKRVALMASREQHCLLDLLWRHRTGELDMDIVLVISNHADAAREVDALQVPFRHVPVLADRKQDAEERALELLAGKVDVVVLARYMQILSAGFLERLGCPVINIHHSFLPAFAGAQPYRRAYERGVKLIGATAHYATEELDAGPIIEQDVERVGHGYTVQDLERVGRDLERLVLARALRSHLDDRVLVHEGRTIVF
jgi:formyltetrahydrofolate deformylase